MAYETLVNTTITMPANKPQYTPAKVFKKALKSVRKLFKKSSNKHQKFLNETIYAHDAEEEADYASEEELENQENELKEALSHQNN